MKPNPRSNNWPLFYNGLMMMAFSAAQLAQAEGGITTDGTAGAVQTLSLPGDAHDVTIQQDLGMTIGNNLFHSFDQFNINTGQTVNFTENTVNTLNNVISRVTGGSSSDINGKLISTPNGHANFYLINPAGIVFGKEAQLDVAGAFHASTANQITFSDGAVLNADKSQASSLSMAAPASFGFLAHTTANNGFLLVDGAQLTAKDGQTLDLVARQIGTGHNATLNAPAGEIRLVAMQGAGKVGLGLITGALPLPDEMPAISTAGNINIHDTDIKTTGNGGGRIGIWGGDVVVSKQSADRKYIDANNIGVQNAGALQGIEIKANNLALDGVAVRAHAQGNGNAGNIRLLSSQDTVLRQGGRIVSDTFGNITGNTSNINLSTGRDLVIDGLNTPENSITGIRTDASENSTGKAGDVGIHSGRNVLLSNGGPVKSSTENDERGGSLTVSAQGNLQIDSKGHVSSLYAGDVNISTGGNILLSNSGFIKSESIKGNSSVVNVQSQANIQVDTKSYIASFDASDVIVGAGRNVIVNGGVIESASIHKNEGNAGNVLVHANGDVFINGYVEKDSNGKPTAIDGYISSTQSGKGNSGNVDLSAGGKLTITNEGGSISTTVLNEGDIAGSVRVNVQGDILITQDADIGSNSQFEVLSNNSNTTGKPNNNQSESGKNGGVNITSGGNLTLSDKGKILSATYNNIHAGDVVVDVKGNVTLSNVARIITNNFQVYNLATGNAGNVNVAAQGDVILDNAYLSSGTSGTGRGGNMTVNVGRNLQMVNSSKLQTESSPDEFSLTQSGDAGNISLQAKEIHINTDSIINSSTSGSGRAGNIDIQADNVSLNKGYIASLSMDANSSGQTGDINITANNRIDFTNSSNISNSSQANLAGAAAITVTPGAIHLTAQQINFDRGMVSTKANGNNGIAGDVVLNAHDINLSNNSQIVSSSKGNSTGGNVLITARDIRFSNHSGISASAEGTGAAGNINISFAHWLNLDNASVILTSAIIGNGGAITIQGGELFSLRNSGLTTTVQSGLGNGGNINVTADILLMDTGLIQANAASGNGGDINLNLKGLIPSGDSLILGGDNIWDSTAPSLNIIQAESETGVSGIPNITAPQLNIVGALVSLNTPELDLNQVGRDPCSDTMRQSSLKKLGKGGVPMFNKGQDSYTIDHLLDAASQDTANNQQESKVPNEKLDCKPKPTELPIQQAETG